MCKPICPVHTRRFYIDSGSMEFKVVRFISFVKCLCDIYSTVCFLTQQTLKSVYLTLPQVNRIALIMH